MWMIMEAAEKQRPQIQVSIPGIAPLHQMNAVMTAANQIDMQSWQLNPSLVADLGGGRFLILRKMRAGPDSLLTINESR